MEESEGATNHSYIQVLPLILISSLGWIYVHYEKQNGVHGVLVCDKKGE